MEVVQSVRRTAVCPTEKQKAPRRSASVEMQEVGKEILGPRLHGASRRPSSEGRVDRAHRLGPASNGSLEGHRLEVIQELLLSFEAGVERPDRYAGTGGHGRDGEGLNALLFQEVPGRFPKPLERSATPGLLRLLRESQIVGIELGRRHGGSMRVGSSGQAPLFNPAPKQGPDRRKPESPSLPRRGQEGVSRSFFLMNS